MSLGESESFDELVRERIEQSKACVSDLKKSLYFLPYNFLRDSELQKGTFSAEGWLSKPSPLLRKDLAKN